MLDYNRLYDGNDAVIQITEEAAVTVGLSQVGTHANGDAQERVKEVNRALVGTGAHGYVHRR